MDNKKNLSTQIKKELSPMVDGFKFIENPEVKKSLGKITALGFKFLKIKMVDITGKVHL